MHYFMGGYVRDDESWQLEEEVSTAERVGLPISSEGLQSHTGHESTPRPASHLRAPAAATVLRPWPCSGRRSVTVVASAIGAAVLKYGATPQGANSPLQSDGHAGCDQPPSTCPLFRDSLAPHGEAYPAATVKLGGGRVHARSPQKPVAVHLGTAPY
jgi:hypothetical protein